MRTSGLVLDVYDDYNGVILREIYPTHDDVPGHVKEAQHLSSEEREHLPDDAFALVLLDGSSKLRKFACLDGGGTQLSIEYFVKNAHKLPVEAQQVAAQNLKVACSWYGVAVPSALEKLALGLDTAMTALTVPSLIKGTTHTIKENLSANKALGGGGNIVTPGARDAALGRKHAEASGTALMPNQPPGDPTQPKPKAVVDKTATIGRLVSASKGDHDTPPDEVHPPTEMQSAQHPQARHLHPTVDVSNKEPPKRLSEKKAQRFALPLEGKYPLDSYAQVKAASAYFDTYYKHMAPETRRTYAENLVKRASDLAISLSDRAQKYGAEDFAPEEEIKAAFDARRLELQDRPEACAVLDQVERVARFRMWKEASAVVQCTAASACSLLAEFDKTAGLDHYYDRSIPDPYFSIYGFEKSAADAEFSEIIGNEMVTEQDLRRLSRIGAFSVKTTFGGDFQEEFLKDPVGMFKSLPRDQKKMMMRLANSTQPGVERTYY